MQPRSANRIIPSIVGARYQFLVGGDAAVFMNLVTILATYGVLVVIFQYGYGAKLLNFTS